MKTKEEMLEGLYYTGYEIAVVGNKPWTEFNSERIEKIREIIKENLEKRKTERVNLLGYGSYSLKHAVEKDENARGILKCYVSNGELIYAMILEGYNVKREGRNAYFNVTMDSAKRFYEKNLYNDRTPL